MSSKLNFMQKDIIPVVITFALIIAFTTLSSSIYSKDSQAAIATELSRQFAAQEVYAQQEAALAASQTKVTRTAVVLAPAAKQTSRQSRAS